MIVVFDASAFISAALKVDSVPERALFRALIEPDKLILSRAVEDEYREVIVRPRPVAECSARRFLLVRMPLSCHSASVQTIMGGYDGRIVHSRG